MTYDEIAEMYKTHRRLFRHSAARYMFDMEADIDDVIQQQFLTLLENGIKRTKHQVSNNVYSRANRTKYNSLRWVEHKAIHDRGGWQDAKVEAHEIISKLKKKLSQEEISLLMECEVQLTVEEIRRRRGIIMKARRALRVKHQDIKGDAHDN